MPDHACIRLHGRFKDDASRLFESLGLVPERVEDRGDGEARFVFANSAEELLPALEAIPPDWWAVTGILGGDGNA